MPTVLRSESVTLYDPTWAILELSRLFERLRQPLQAMWWPERETPPDPGKPYGRQVLIDTESSKVVLIQWRPKMRCAIHDHGGGHGMIFILQGEVEESYWENAASLISGQDAIERRHLQGSFFPLPPQRLHTMMSSGEEAAVTLHFYQGESRAMSIYDAPRRRQLLVPTTHGAWLPSPSQVLQGIPWAP